MSADEKGFTVVDRRPFDDQGNARADQAGEDNADAGQPAAPAADDSACQERKAGAKHCQMPPVEFSGLVLSLATAAMTHMGAMPHPDGQQDAEPDLVLARHSIDTLGMLKEKTAGNLSDDERRLLDNILTDLRLAYVQLCR